ncbi:hypothetical protein MTO96_018908 [Rhipicephalus appendiculatus]
MTRRSLRATARNARLGCLNFEKAAVLADRRPASSYALRLAFAGRASTPRAGSESRKPLGSRGDTERARRLFTARANRFHARLATPGCLGRHDTVESSTAVHQPWLG